MLKSGSKVGVSKRLVLSYVIDWIIIIAIAAVGAGFSTITPNKRPFNITDPDISFPYVPHEKISTGLLVVIGLVIPAITIVLVSVFIGLGPEKSEDSPSRSAGLGRKLWEWNAGWMGLALSLAIAFIITNGTKNLVGKPRPDLLARCNPDPSQILNSTVGGVGQQLDEGINLVSWTICRNAGNTLDDGFRSFPSGHSSFSFAGLTYLALFFCAKFAITLPFLNYKNPSNRDESDLTSPRSQAAAPPTYLVIFPLISIALAIYVASTRYSDFYHHGFDIIVGAILGIASAWLGFRWYHLPIGRGGGWAWAPRSPDRAFIRGIGVVTYANDWPFQGNGRDLESGPVSNASRGTKNSDGSAGIELDDMGQVKHLEPGVPNNSTQQPPR